MVSELTDKGFIIRSAGSGKKYKNRFTLTDSGKSIARDLDSLIDNALEYVSGAIPKADLEVFYRTLFTISDNLFSLTEKPEALSAAH